MKLCDRCWFVLLCRGDGSLCSVWLWKGDVKKGWGFVVKGVGKVEIGLELRSEGRGMNGLVMFGQSNGVVVQSLAW